MFRNLIKPANYWIRNQKKEYGMLGSKPPKNPKDDIIIILVIICGISYVYRSVCEKK
jgi:hypothetical protein